jgi:hypothetical protein
MISRYLAPVFTITAIAAAGSVLPISSASAVTMSIQGLYTTGVNNSGQALVGIQADPHYTLISQPSGAKVTNSTISPVPAGWAPDNSTSRWIGTNTSAPIGNYVYQTSFTLPNTAILSTTSINGSWGSDDSATIFVNGIATGVASDPSQFGKLNPFTLSSNNFQYGTNNLTFVVNNSQGLTGLRVAAISGTYEAVPEPLTILGSIAALGFGAKMERKFRRKKAKKAESEA